MITKSSISKLFVLILFLTTHACALQTAKRLAYDIAGIGAEWVYDANSTDTTLRTSDRFASWACFGSTSAAKIASRPLLLSFEATGINRQITMSGLPESFMVPQRYGFFVGYSFVKLHNSSGTLFAGSGVAGTFNELVKENAYVHLIYDHRFKGTKNFSWGLGILFKYRFGEIIPFPNLLLSMDWKITPVTYLKASWDVVSLSHFVTPQLALVGEMRYDLHFFALDSKDGYTFESAGVGCGLDYMVTKNIAVRLRYKKFVLNREQINYTTSDVFLRSNSKGQSVKLSVVYGK